MSYESVIKQVKNTPAQYLREMSQYIEFLNQKDEAKPMDDKTPAQRFLALSWKDNRDADEIIKEFESGRGSERRFEENNALFD